jgi:hypothetical protein
MSTYKVALTRTYLVHHFIITCKVTPQALMYRTVFQVPGEYIST